METSPRLQLPYIMPSQAQKHVTHNEALRLLDCLVQPVVQSNALGSPPAAPVEGDAYVVGDAASGDWNGHEREIAVFQDGAWVFIAPRAGWAVSNLDGENRLVFDGSDWAADRSTGGSGLAWFGINTEADATNRLAVAADATLLSHDGTDHRVKINKAAEADTASLMFQTGWSGRAEFGLAGDDDWRLKVSADGIVWKQALKVDTGSGFVLLGDGTGSANAPLHVKDGRAVSGGYGKPFKVHATGAAANDTVQFGVGVSETNYNQAEFNFKYQGAGDVANSFSIGLYGLPQIIRVRGTGAVEFPSVATTAASPNAVLDSGASNGLLRSTSSESYKRDIEPLDTARARALLETTPIWYRSKAPADDPDWSWYGFSAEQVAAIDPRMVHWGYGDDAYETIEITDADGAVHRERRLRDGAEKSPQGVAYDRFVVHLLCLVKDCRERIEELEMGPNRGSQ
ncbi:MAG: hypothetical protein CL535_18465 [Ahrensia sp.]|nr:hypothetical protein [Ahrensia sp.]|tara:strand:+ start:34572 stop:35939 length:1368 start_codon:yes stop_codon:yes gene_type:complete